MDGGSLVKLARMSDQTGVDLRDWVRISAQQNFKKAKISSESTKKKTRMHFFAPKDHLH